MGIFSRFENKAEDVIEGSGGRGRGGIEPVKLAKRACKEMEHEKMIGVGTSMRPRSTTSSCRLRTMLQ